MNTFHFPVKFGTVLIGWNLNERLTCIQWHEGVLPLFPRTSLPNHFYPLVDQLKGYFWEGEPIDTIPWESLEISNWSAFQARVYEVTSCIPHGETRTYGWVASRLGQPSASRAVGQALRKNPFPILIPCHRVKGCQSLGGYLGAIDPTEAKIKLKKKLILLEEEYRAPLFSFLTPSVNLVV